MSEPSRKDKFSQEAKATWSNITHKTGNMVQGSTGALSGLFKRKKSPTATDYMTPAADYSQYPNGSTGGGYGGTPAYGSNGSGQQPQQQWPQGYQPYAPQQTWYPPAPVGYNPDGSPYWQQPAYDQSQTFATPGGYPPAPSTYNSNGGPDGSQSAYNQSQAPTPPGDYATNAPNTASVYSTPAPVSSTGPSVPPTAPSTNS